LAISNYHRAGNKFKFGSELQDVKCKSIEVIYIPNTLIFHDL